jgi:Na+/H+-dicarboxylate symporter
MLLYLLMEVIACALSAGVCFLTRLTGLPFAQSLSIGAGGAALEATTLSLRDFLVGIVPSNFLQPFLDSNMLQLMFLGVLCGIAVGEIGDYSKPLRDFIEACYELFMKITGILTQFIPIAVLCSIWSLVLTTGTDLLLSLVGVLAIVLCGMVALVCIDCIRLRLAGLSPRHFLKKYAPAMAHVFSTTSSSASLPENMKAAKSMGVPEKIDSLSLPLGVIFSKNGSIFYRATTSLLIAQLFGIEVSAAGIVPLLISASVITLATPGIPGGAFIAFSALLLQLGVPSEALACIIGIDAVMDLFIGVVNCFGTMVSTVTVSHREQSLDVARYNEMP